MRVYAVIKTKNIYEVASHLGINDVPIHTDDELQVEVDLQVLAGGGYCPAGNPGGLDLAPYTERLVIQA